MAALVCDSQGGGGAAGGRIQRVKTHVIPFTDDSGHEALMTFDGWVSCPLPPLFSFAIYLTHPEVTLEIVKPVEVLEAIKRKTPTGVYLNQGYLSSHALLYAPE